MSGAAHTPGPWTFETRGDGYHVKGSIKGHPVRIATVHGMQSHDAHLIAAAPDLLALAKEFADSCADCMGGTPAERAACEHCADIRAVIAKAEVAR